MSKINLKPIIIGKGSTEFTNMKKKIQNNFSNTIKRLNIQEDNLVLFPKEPIKITNESRAVSLEILSKDENNENFFFNDFIINKIIESEASNFQFIQIKRNLIEIVFTNSKDADNFMTIASEWEAKKIKWNPNFILEVGNVFPNKIKGYLRHLNLKLNNSNCSTQLINNFQDINSIDKKNLILLFSTETLKDMLTLSAIITAGPTIEKFKPHTRRHIHPMIQQPKENFHIIKQYAETKEPTNQNKITIDVTEVFGIGIANFNSNKNSQIIQIHSIEKIDENQIKINDTPITINKSRKSSEQRLLTQSIETKSKNNSEAPAKASETFSQLDEKLYNQIYQEIYQKVQEEITKDISNQIQNEVNKKIDEMSNFFNHHLNENFNHIKSLYFEIQKNSKNINDLLTDNNTIFNFMNNFNNFQLNFQELNSNQNFNQNQNQNQFQNENSNENQNFQQNQTPNQNSNLQSPSIPNSSFNSPNTPIPVFSNSNFQNSNYHPYHQNQTPIQPNNNFNSPQYFNYSPNKFQQKSPKSSNFSNNFLINNKIINDKEIFFKKLLENLQFIFNNSKNHIPQKNKNSDIDSKINEINQMLNNANKTIISEPNKKFIRDHIKNGASTVNLKGLISTYESFNKQ